MCCFVCCHCYPPLLHLLLLHLLLHLLPLTCLWNVNKRTAKMKPSTFELEM